jgi:transcriptional regulator GlxA family with amidase domain
VDLRKGTTKQVLRVKPLAVTVRESSSFASTGDVVVDGVLQEIMQNPGMGLNLEAWAKGQGVSRSQLLRRFGRSLGRSPAEIAREFRVGHVVERLRHTRMPLKEIAFENGFESAAAFSNFVRRHTGKTPGELREG